MTVSHPTQRFAALAMLALAAAATARADDAPLPLNRMIGQRAEDFELTNTLDAKPIRLYGYAFQKDAAVVVFMGTDCPVGNLYMTRLAELAKKYEDKRVQFLLVNSNASEPAEKVAEHARSYGITFPALKDEGNKLADQLMIERTCEALVLDGQAKIRYRGAIDDQYARKGRKVEPAHDYLVAALDAVLAGKAPETPATPVEGCLIERAAKSEDSKPRGPRVHAAAPSIAAYLSELDAKVKVGPVTYAKDVAPIVQNKCQACHRPGQVAPFSLLSYDDAKRWGPTLREVVAERRMPPWHADPRHGRFENDRSLSPEQRATVLAWVDQGMPLGDAKDLPEPRSFAEGWTIGKPDVVIEMPEPYAVPAQGVVSYQLIRIKAPFDKDTWVQAAEAQPGDRSIVHHIIAYVVPAGKNMGESVRDGHLCGYAPGEMPSIYPKGTAKLIPGGADIVFQMHYTPDGKAKSDKSRLGIILAKDPVERRAYTLGIANPALRIPPGDSNYEVKSRFTFPWDAKLIAFMPHMHLRGKDFLYEVTYPGKDERETLLSVPAYDFGWQSYYRYGEPIDMPKGTRIDCTAHFDNSEENPYNPDPKKAVRWGEQTWDEMMIGYIDFSVKVEDVPNMQPNRNGAGSVREVLRTLQGQPPAQKPAEPARKPE
ncbi:MAG: redoxin domain-containing protein [Isosphaeraceae bacterium]